MGASGLKGNRAPVPPQGARSGRCRCTPAQVLSSVALDTAFHKFLKLPLPALAGAHFPDIPPLLPQLWANGGADRGRRGRRTAPGPQRRPEAPDSARSARRPGSRPQGRCRLAAPAPLQPRAGGETRGAGVGRDREAGRGEGVSSPRYQGSSADLKPRDFLNWPLGQAAGDLRPRPLLSPG